MGSGLIFRTVRLFEESFFPAPLPARLVFEPQTKKPLLLIIMLSDTVLTQCFVGKNFRKGLRSGIVQYF